jgi:hypothetical protein
MTRSALIDMAVREAMADVKYYACGEGPLHCAECRNWFWARVRKSWPRLLASHPITEQQEVGT